MHDSPAGIAREPEGAARSVGAEVTGRATQLATLTVGNDHRITFIDVSDGRGQPSIVVTEEHGARWSPVLAELTELSREGVTAHDAFYALSAPGTRVPERIALVERGLTAVPQGWGLTRVQRSDARAVSRADERACNDNTFVSSTYGGILPNNDAWLNRHPLQDYLQFLYDSDSVDHYQWRTSFTLARHNIRQYRGKVCFETVEGAGIPTHNYYHEVLQRLVPLYPDVRIQYRRPGEDIWTTAQSMRVPAGQTRSMSWAWFGYYNQEWDWRVHVIAALEQDGVDYMRSYLD